MAIVGRDKIENVYAKVRMPIQIKVFDPNSDDLDPTLEETFTSSEISIGRAQENDLVLSFDEVSTSHCLLRVREVDGTAKLFITDLASTNGTKYQRESLSPFQETEVGETARITVGSVVLQVQLASENKEEEIEETPKSEQESVREVQPAGLELVVPPKDDEIDKIFDRTPVNLEDDETLEIEAKKKRTAEQLTEEMNKDESEGKTMLEEVTLEESSAAGAEEIYTKTVTAKEENIEVEIEAFSLITLSGQVLRPNGQPVSGVRLILGSGEVVLSDDEGKFLFENLVETEKVEIFASKDGFDFEDNAVEVLIEDGATINFTAIKLVEVIGKIQHRGQPLEGVAITTEEFGLSETDSSGIFTIANVPEGTTLALQLKKDGFVFKDKLITAESTDEKEAKTANG